MTNGRTDGLCTDCGIHQKCRCDDEKASSGLSDVLSVLRNNDEARLGVLYCLLNVSTELDLETEDAIKVMQACEERLPNGAALDVYWQAWIKA